MYRPTLLAALLLAAPAVLSGCSSGAPYKPSSENREPYEVEPQTVVMHMVPDDEWAEVTQGWPMITKGYAVWSEGKTCHIYFPASDGAPSRYVLSHELRHCIKGTFHD